MYYRTLKGRGAPASSLVGQVQVEVSSRLPRRRRLPKKLGHWPLGPLQQTAMQRPARGTIPYQTRAPSDPRPLKPQH
eukprot:scaffold9896_cov90-Isochrysis_galbana.AAC.1